MPPTTCRNDCSACLKPIATCVAVAAAWLFNSALPATAQVAAPPRANGRVQVQVQANGAQAVQVQLQVNPFGGVVGPQNNDEEDDQDGRLSPRVAVDRELSRRIETARELFERKNYRVMLDVLQRGILDRRAQETGGSADYFLDQEMTRSLRREAQALIGSLPPEGRRLYELQYGVAARQLLDQAADGQQAETLQEVSRRFFHTEAGYRATWLLGSVHLDRGEPQAAARHFERLRALPEAVTRHFEPMLSMQTALAWTRAGVNDRAQTVLAELHRRSTGVNAAGAPAPAKTLAWLKRMTRQHAETAPFAEELWSVFRGNASRNASTAPVSPVWNTRWSYPTIERPVSDNSRQYAQVAQRLRELQQQRASSGELTMPVGHPLVAGDVIIFNTLSNLRAVNRHTGQVLWEEFRLSKPWEYLVEQGNNEAVPVRNGRQQSPLDLFLGQRTWRNLTTGSLSTDGRLVFCVGALGFVGPWQQQAGMPRHKLLPQNTNRLMAYSLTGGLRWEVGGPRGDIEVELAGNFFLGPPLPVNGKLYCLTETLGEIRLLVLDAATGSLLWWQSLLLTDESLQQSPARRFSGAGVASAEGIVVCPTAAGAVVAVDLATRELLWGFRYREPETPVDPQNRMLQQMQQALKRNAGLYFEEDESWQDSTPVIARGRVLLTPADASELYCLRLSDGTLEWSRPRERGLYVAGVRGNHVILVSRTQVEALDLANGGQPVWPEPIPIPPPSGRGTRAGRYYSLPLSTAEITTIDLETGRLLARSPSDDGEVAGNLVAVDGMLISQSATQLRGFVPLQTLETQLAARLERNSRDAEALALRGELQLHSGREQQGLATLRHALQLQPGLDRARSVLASALLDGLRTDFPRYRDAARELEQLITEDDQLWTFHRRYAAGLSAAGEHLQAFQELERFAGPAASTAGLRPIGDALALRSDRWFRSQAQQMYGKASPAEQNEIARRIQAEIEEALATATIDPAASRPVNREVPVVAPRPGDRERGIRQRQAAALRRLLQYYERLPVAEFIQLQLLERLTDNSQNQQRERLLEDLRQSHKPALAASATSQLAAMRLQHPAGREVATLLDDLATRFSAVPLPGGTTGQARAAELRQLAAARRPPGAVWPDRKLTATRTARRGSVQQRYPVTIEGPQGTVFANWRLELDQRRQFLTAFDGRGGKRWSLALRNLRDPQGRQLPTPGNMGNYARVDGHLMGVVLGGTLLCLDGLTEAETPSVLWMRTLYEQLAGAPFTRGVQVRQFMVGPARRNAIVLDPWGRQVGRLGVMTDDVACFQQGTSVFGVDPATGSTVWERRNLPRGSRLFGDERYIFVAPEGARQAMMLDASTGEYLASTLLPQGDGLVTSRGSQLVLREAGEQAGQIKLSGRDAASGETLWSLSLDEGTQFHVIDGTELAAMEPGGRFLVLEIDSGRPVVDLRVRPEKDLEHIIVRRDDSGYLLMTNRPDNVNVNVRAVPVGMNNPLINGHVYAIDRATGQLRWGREVLKQAFDLAQPERLPVLIFTVRTYQLVRQGRQFNPNQFAVLVLDRRNGQVVYSGSGSESLAPYELEAHPEQGTLQIRFYRSQLEIQASSEPLEDPVVIDTSRAPVEAPRQP